MEHKYWDRDEVIIVKLFTFFDRVSLKIRLALDFSGSVFAYKQNFSTDTRKTAQVYAHSKANKICSSCAKLQRSTMQLHEDTKIGRNYI